MGFYDGRRTSRICFMPDQIAIWRHHAAFSDAPLGIHGSLWVTPSTILGMLLRDADNPIWFGFKGDAHVLVLSMHVGPLFDAGRDDPRDRGDRGWRITFLD
jgi:hypothetical protein